MEHIITEEQDGRLLKDLLRRDLGLSSSLVRRLKTIPMGITLDGEHVTVRAAVRCGQVLRLKSEDSDYSQNIEPVAGELPIVYEDDDIIIINKPFGMPVHPSPGHGRDTVANILAWRFRQENRPFVFRAVNRLDSGTGGLMCMAKNARAAAALGSNMAQKSIRRTYEAVLEGDLKEDSGTISAPIGLAEGSGIRRCVREDGEEAITRFRVLERKNGLTRAEIELETGRTHQIRVHFSHLGHPVWGDFMYGTETDFGGWALFSKRIRLTGPTAGREIDISADVPVLFDSLMNKTVKYKNIRKM